MPAPHPAAVRLLTAKLAVDNWARSALAQGAALERGRCSGGHAAACTSAPILASTGCAPKAAIPRLVNHRRAAP